jgi:hypothetical protein
MMDPSESPPSNTVQKDSKSESAASSSSLYNPRESNVTTEPWISPAALLALTSDYSDITQLVGRLDKQLETFDQVMNKLQQDILIQESLTALWEEQTQSLQRQDRIVDAADEHMDYFKTRNETG